MTVADVLARWLRSLGVDCAFFMHSHQLEGLLPSLWDEGVRPIPAATETGAGFAAHGASGTGRPGVALSGGGPGLAMLVPAVRAAVLEGGPVLFIVGQSAKAGHAAFQDTGPDGSRDTELLRALLPGAVFEIPCAADLPDALNGAEKALAESRPAVITVPVDVQGRPITDRADLAPLLGPAPDPAANPARARPNMGDATRRSITDAPILGYRDLFTVMAGPAAADAKIFVDAGQARHAARMTPGLAFRDAPVSAPMGWAISAALGSAMSQPGTRHIAVVGDGSALMLGNEFATIAATAADVAVVLCTNGAWGGPHSRLAGTPGAALGLLPPIDWIGFGRSLGLPSHLAAGADMFRRSLLGRGARLVVVPTPMGDETVHAPYAL